MRRTFLLHVYIAPDLGERRRADCYRDLEAYIVNYQRDLERRPLSVDSIKKCNVVCVNGTYLYYERMW